MVNILLSPLMYSFSYIYYHTNTPSTVSFYFIRFVVHPHSKRKMNVNVSLDVLPSLSIFRNTLSFLYEHPLFSFCPSSTFKTKHLCQSQFIRVINTPFITSSSTAPSILYNDQRHLRQSTKKNRNHKNHRHLVIKTSFNLLVILV